MTHVTGIEHASGARREKEEAGRPPPHWYVPKIDGYHVRLSKEKTNSGKQCLAVQRGEGKAGPLGNVMQQVDAAPYQATL